jgi:hypothetical protein
MKRLAIVMTVGALAAACGSPGTPVPVVGTPLDLQRLAGEWVGEYSSVQTGRSGSIIFHLIAGTDSATGDVVMDPVVWGWRARPPEPNQPGAVPGRLPQAISIRIVRVTGNQVTGRLAPYTDPTCDCPLYTRFEGRLTADTLDGTYTSRHQAGGTTQSGRWRVVRSKP